jgi:hypothetical protein
MVFLASYDVSCCCAIRPHYVSKCIQVAQLVAIQLIVNREIFRQIPGTCRGGISSVISALRVPRIQNITKQRFPDVSGCSFFEMQRMGKVFLGK